MISIIIPVYNVEKYLSKCIESLMRQTNKDIEIILINDGSSDNCLNICEHYSKKDNRIIVVNQENKGVSAARNAGLKIAKGEYIGFIDPDDWVATDMYEGLQNAIKRDAADMAICGYEYYSEERILDEKRKYPVHENEIITQKEVMHRFSDMPPTIRHGVVNKLFKKEILKEQMFKEGLHSAEDVFFLNEYVQKIQKAVIVHKPYYKNLVRQGSATHGGLSIDSLADSFEAHYKMYQDAVKKYPELKDHSLAFLLDVCVLKYKEACEKAQQLELKEKGESEKRLTEMKRFIKRYAVRAIFDKEIYWKTRIAYLLL
ncbi:glycosyltransferase family 2 protein [Murimonas intestini]|uniref:glycosyltransferase family 2 protein n=1 Tax=Murimonas intestini TaxID=1337051 RepID=UPI0011DCF57E|nr:glycosyltransferase family 2 protein [Murimonas intestini]